MQVKCSSRQSPQSWKQVVRLNRLPRLQLRTLLK